MTIERHEASCVDAAGHDTNTSRTPFGGGGGGGGGSKSTT